MTLLIFIIVLSVLVLIHELGHFLAARAFGVKAQEFGYGFPPRAIGWTRYRGKWKRIGSKDRTEYPNTIWSLNWLPFGGFVRIKGEDIDGIRDPDSMHSKAIWKRIVIIAAGVIMNWLLAVCLFTAIFSSGTLTILEDLPSGAQVTHKQILVTDIMDSSPASQAGFQAGDDLLSVNGRSFDSAEAMRSSIQAAGTSQVDVMISRNGVQKDIKVAPKQMAGVDHPVIGVSLADAGIVSFSVPQAFVHAVQLTGTLTVEIVVALGGIVHDLWVTHTVSPDVSGPIGVAVITGQVVKQGINALLYFVAVLSINLAIINFLPIPALDGGRAMFLVIEKVRRKPMNRELEIKIHNTAFLVLILLIILITARDVMRYSGVIFSGFKGMFGM